MPSHACLSQFLSFPLRGREGVIVGVVSGCLVFLATAAPSLFIILPRFALIRVFVDRTDLGDAVNLFVSPRRAFRIGIQAGVGGHGGSAVDFGLMGDADDEGIER